MIKVLGISKRKWAALDKSKALQQPQPRMKVKQTKQRKCTHEKKRTCDKPTKQQIYKSLKKKAI